MWVESSGKINASQNNSPSTLSVPRAAEIAYVEAGSIGEELGFEAGDKIISINGTKPRDLIDYQFLIADEELELEIIDQKEEIHTVSIEKDADQGLGIEFKEALFDELKQCNNRCSFCFIDQQPKGHRQSLYLKDDDYRLSFLYGSYLTLTNLNEQDWARIEEQRLSPLFISVHATNPKLRAKLLKNPKAVLLIDQLKWFQQRKLQIHAQIVVCPGLNDGDSLKETLRELSQFAKGDWPTILSTAVVPVGLTRFRPDTDVLIQVNRVCAEKVIKIVEELQNQFHKDFGSRFAWLSDEWYLIAHKPLPPRSNYEDLPQQENGVGSIRAFLEEMDAATSNLPTTLKEPKSCSWVVGRIVEKALQGSCERLNSIKGLKFYLHGLPSPYWGQEEIVTGLLTGQDLIEGLQGLDLGEQLLLPSVMLKRGETIFLDDMTLKEVSKILKIPIRIVHGADDIVAAAMGELEEVR